MAPAGPKVSWLLAFLLVGLIAHSSAETLSQSSKQSSTSGTAGAAAKQGGPGGFLASVLGGGDAAAREASKGGSESASEDVASLRSMWGYDANGNPQLEDSASSDVGIAVVDAKHRSADSAGEQELLQTFDAEEDKQQQQQQQQQQQRRFNWRLGRRSAKQQQQQQGSKERPNVGAAWVERRIKPLLAAIKVRAPAVARGGSRARKYTRQEVEEIVRVMADELKTKQAAQPAAATDAAADSSSGDAAAQQQGQEPVQDSYDDTQLKDLLKQLKHHKKGAANTLAHDSTRSHTHAHKPHKHAPAAADLDAEDVDPYAAAETYTESPLGPLAGDSSSSSDRDAAAHKAEGPKDSTHQGHAKADSAQQDKAGKKAAHSGPGAAHSEVRKQVLKARKADHASQVAQLASSKDSTSAGAKSKHKKAHSASPVAATVAAKRAAHKASKKAQALGASDVDDIQTILEAIYDKDAAGAAGISGEQAATLAEIQAALQPHIITDDPASFAVGYTGEDSVAAASASAEQAASKSSSPTSTAAAPKPAQGVEAQGAAEDVEYEYIEEEVEVDENGVEIASSSSSGSGKHSDGEVVEVIEEVVGGDVQQDAKAAADKKAKDSKASKGAAAKGASPAKPKGAATPGAGSAGSDGVDWEWVVEEVVEGAPAAKATKQAPAPARPISSLAGLPTADELEAEAEAEAEAETEAEVEADAEDALVDIGADEVQQAAAEEEEEPAAADVGAKEADAPAPEPTPTKGLARIVVDRCANGGPGCPINCTARGVDAIPGCLVCLPGDNPLGVAGVTCQFCSPGYYQEGPKKCVLCPKGAFCGGKELKWCKPGFTTIEAGRWSELQCNLCADGFGAASTSSSTLSCAKCALGSFSPGDTALPCQHCPAFTMSIDLQSSGRFGVGGTQCLPCPAGLVADDSQTGCRCPASNRLCSCPAGWASIGETGAPPCMRCGPQNTYAAEGKEAGSKSCVACPRDSVATDGTTCACKAGFYSRDGTPFTQGGCVPCGPDSVATQSGTTRCALCAPNTVPNEDRTQCTASAQQQ